MPRCLVEGEDGRSAGKLGPWVLLAALLPLVGCEGCFGGAESGADAGPSEGAEPVVPSGGRTVYDFVANVGRCDVDHRGLTVDMGTDAIVGRIPGDTGVPPDLKPLEHHGATWTAVHRKTLKLRFTLPEPTPVFVSARLRGHRAKSAVVGVDGATLGTLRFSRDEIQVASTPTTKLPLDAGMHTLTIRFLARGRDKDKPRAEVDWVHVGVPDELEATFGAPTLSDVVNARAALGGVPHASLALRAPGAVRCALRVPAEGRLKTSVGMQGVGEARAEIRVLRDGEEPVTLHQSLVTGGEDAQWKAIDLDLDSFAGKFVTLELRSASGTPSGRLLFGDPAVSIPSRAPPEVQPARAVVVVVLDGVSRQELPPWSKTPTPHLATLSRLAAEATIYERHRAPSTVVSSVMATLLTGQLPRAHALEDADARLSASTTHIGQIAHEASVHSAFFTGVPGSFEAFGFNSGWDDFVAHSPVSGVPSTAPLDDAAKWLGALAEREPEARVLLIVHARGGHPPWPVTEEEMAQLPPVDYTGDIRSRNAAQTLAKLRKRRKFKLGEPDSIRMRALHALSLSRQDKAIADLVDALESAKLWDDTLFVVTADVASSTDSLFAEGSDLEESHLQLPLYVSFPRGQYAAQRVEAPTTMPDLTFTAFRALGLDAPETIRGHDLAGVASGASVTEMEPQIATLADRYSIRWGHMVLHGKLDDARPALCHLRLDPTCSFDRHPVLPMTGQAILREFLAYDATIAAPKDKREPATIDDDTTAALKVWGALE